MRKIFLIESTFLLLVSTLFCCGEKREISIKHNLPYAGKNHSRQTLDLFLPKNQNSSKKIPIIVWIHGGAWKSGSKKSGHNPHRIPQIVKTGRYAGASIGYRLSSESKWPTQIHDCKAAIRWIRGNANSIGVDPEKIGVWGSSAGGHLASMLGTTADVNSLNGNVGDYSSLSTKVHAVVNYYGPSAFLRMDDHPGKIRHNSPFSPESLLIGAPIQSSKLLARNASPLHHVTEGDTPHMNFHGKLDSLVPFQQSVLLHQALNKCKVQSFLISVSGAGHQMPASFTGKFVIPYFDFQFFNIGKAPENLSI